MIDVVAVFEYALPSGRRRGLCWLLRSRFNVVVVSAAVRSFVMVFYGAVRLAVSAAFMASAVRRDGATRPAVACGRRPRRAQRIVVRGEPWARGGLMWI